MVKKENENINAGEQEKSDTIELELHHPIEKTTHMIPLSTYLRYLDHIGCWWPPKTGHGKIQAEIDANIQMGEVLSLWVTNQESFEPQFNFHWEIGSDSVLVDKDEFNRMCKNFFKIRGE